MKRILSALFAVVLCVSAFSACGSDGGDKTVQTTAASSPVIDDGKLVIAAGGISDYSIILPSDRSTVVEDFAESVQALIQEKAGAELALSDDSAEAGAYEILIGGTNREESAQAMEQIGEYDYIVTLIGEKLVIYAPSVNDYKTALSYLKNILGTDSRFALPVDLCHRGNKITTFVADEKIDGNTQIDITVTPYNNQAQVGLFVGDPSDKGMFGYSGYCLIATKNTLTLYEMGSGLKEMASKNIKGVASDKEMKLRLEIDGTILRAYLLDDAEGFTPWPEFELAVPKCTDSSIGYVELSGHGCVYGDFAVSYPESGQPSGITYTNAIYDEYADPDVLLYDGTYYLYATGGSGYMYHTSKDLVNWKKGGIAVKPNLWGITKNYWAPDVEYINGKFYMVVSCDEHLGIAVSDSPKGPFSALHENVLYDSSIDGHLFVDDDGTVYLYYVSWRSGHTYGIYGVQLDENMQPIADTEKLLITATQSWETQQSPVAEGPYMLKHNGIYYLTYSGSHYESIHYAVGYATSDSPLGKYKKYDLNPIMKGNTQIHGTGHHCITTTPDGSEMVIVYHCHNSLTAVQVRKICIDRIRFSPVEGEMDRLEVYGPTVVQQQGPIQ